MDMERYGDYNEIDEPPRGKRNPVIILIKIFIALVCITVVGILGFRMVLFNYYPDSMKKLYFNDTLTNHYNEMDGAIVAETQDMRFPYDDPDSGNFFCDNLIVIKDAGQLQVSLRYNQSVFKKLAEEYAKEHQKEGLTLELNPEDEDVFTFRLCRDPRSNDAEDGEDTGEVIAEPVGTLTVNNREEFMMYTYHKLVFDGIDFGSEDEPKVEWLRLEIFVKGMDEPKMVLIYENNAAFSAFTPYELSDGEVPKVD